MSEIAKTVLDIGGLVVMASLFVYGWLQDRNKTNRTLEELSKSNTNIAQALNLLKMSYDTQKALLQEHDERAGLIHQDIKEIKTILNVRGGGES